MLKDNESITFEGEKIVEVLSEIEYMLISLRDIANYYYQRPDYPPSEGTDVAYALETTRFIDENRIGDRLNKMRNILSLPFNDELGEDKMDDIERAVEHLDYWRKPGD
jgi:hypothetical protein